jgi:hypothetical protein
VVALVRLLLQRARSGGLKGSYRSSSRYATSGQTSRSYGASQMPSVSSRQLYPTAASLSAALTIALLLLPALAPPAAAASRVGISKKIKVPTVDMAQSARHSAGSTAGTGGPLLVYHGGPVLNVPAIYLSFWGPEWASSASQPAISYVEGFQEPGWQSLAGTEL